MSISKSIPLADILVPERLRTVDEDHALAIQASIVEHGLLNPVTVRQTPNGKQGYSLVAGAHRYRAVELLDEALPKLTRQTAGLTVPPTLMCAGMGCSPSQTRPTI